MTVAKLVFAKMKIVAVSVIALEPPLAERLRAVVAVAQKRAVLDALEPLAPARALSDELAQRAASLRRKLSSPPRRALVVRDSHQLGSGAPAPQVAG